MTLLTNADKLNVVNQHMKSIDFQMYNLQLDLIEANAESPVNSENVSNITGKINALTTKRTALESEAETLEG
jgi:transcriptional regulator NrdR family protein